MVAAIRKKATPSTDPVRAYLHEIGRISLLSREEEISFGKDVQAMMAALSTKEELTEQLGHEPCVKAWAEAIDLDQTELERILAVGKRARKRMIEGNLRLVVSVAKKFQGRGMELLDLIQEGSIGLNRAVEKFDPTKGYRFSTYSYWWIRQAITRAIPMQSRTIRLPVHIVEKLNKFKRVRRELMQKLGRTPKLEEVADEMDTTVVEVRNCMTLMNQTVSLDMLVGDNQESSLIEVLKSDSVSPETYADEQILREEAYQKLSVLTDREREVMMLRHGFDGSKGQTLAQLGRSLKVSRERVRQIQKSAVYKLKVAEKRKQKKDLT